MTFPKQINAKIVLCVLIALGAVYQGVSWTLIDPWTQLQSNLAHARVALANARREADRIPGLQARWQEAEVRTFPEYAARNGVDQLMKQLLHDSGLDHLNVTCNSGAKLTNSQIARVACHILAEGNLQQVVKFLWALYTHPLLTRITKLHIAPLDGAGGGANMKLDVQVETLVFPPAPTSASKSRARAASHPAEPAGSPLDRMGGLARLRTPAFPAADYCVIRERNIFASFEAPPKGVVHVQNEDRLPVDVTVESFWHDERLGRETFHLDGKGNKETAPLLGNRITATAKYEDGQSYSPTRPFENHQRFDTTTRSYTFRVTAHTPPPPKPPPPEPKDVQVVIHNNDDKTIKVQTEMEVNGKLLPLAELSVVSRNIFRMEKLETPRLILTAHYDGGGKFGPATFTPKSTRPMEWTVPPKSLEPTGDENDVDPPADVNLKVTGLWTYPGGAELIAGDTVRHARRLFTLYDRLDGGELIFVHSLGGIVRMPNGHFYLYPLGRPFTERALLSAKTRVDLPQSMVAWSVADAENPVRSKPGNPAPSAAAPAGGAPTPLRPGRKFQRGQ